MKPQIKASDMDEDYLKKVVDYGILNNVRIFVFGCPINRKILNIRLNIK